MSSILSRFRCAHLAIGIWVALVPAVRAQQPPPAPDAQKTLSEALESLLRRCTKKVEAGQRSEAEFAPELKELDELAARFGNTGSAESTQFRLIQAMIYVQAFGWTEKAIAVLERAKQDKPRGDLAKQLAAQLEFLHQRLAMERTTSTIIGKPAPSLKFIWSNREGLKSLASLRGKVVVLDFWFSGSKPSLAAFPALHELVAHYEGTDVVVVGVTSLQGRVDGLPGGAVDCTDNPANEKRLLGIFARVKGLTWPLALLEEPVFGPRFGVTSPLHLAIIAPDGVVRYNGLDPSLPLAEKTARIDAILKEFKLRVP